MSVETPANGDRDTESQAAEAWGRSKQLERSTLPQLFEIGFPIQRSGIDHSTTGAVFTARLFSSDSPIPSLAVFSVRNNFRSAAPYQLHF